MHAVHWKVMGNRLMLDMMLWFLSTESLGTGTGIEASQAAPKHLT